MSQVEPHTILLGGIGGDSHSVGLHILRQALSLNGYRVFYLGTQNPVEEFFQAAFLCNVAMISSMDGHARHYLAEFPELMRKYNAYGNQWYLGGNLCIDDGFGYERHFMEMGFSRVFVKFVDIRTVLQVLERDLHGTEPKAGNTALWETMLPKPEDPSSTVTDESLEPDVFNVNRSTVLQHWKTGMEARDLETNAEFLQRQPSFPRLQARSNARQIPILAQPRSGVALVPEQIRLFQAFTGIGAKVLSYQVDSLTRNNDYLGVEEMLRESRVSKTSLLNGFPVINQGVTNLRRIISEVKVPLQSRHSTRDPRLLADISYAGGVTAFEGGAICYNIPYYKDYPLHESIRTWQYVDRLTGHYYEQFGILLDREFFGTLTGTLVPPCLAIATGLLESILAVKQGVRCLSLGYAEQGHRIQDIAAIRVMKEMATEILDHMGYQNVQINTVFHQYMAAFPQIAERAEELIYNSAITATLSGATRMLVKTPAEAYKIPNLSDNCHGLHLTLRGIQAAADETIDEGRVTEEASIIRSEVQSIFDSILMCGHGSITRGIIEGFQKGYIDIPFAPSLYNRGGVMTARDVEGAVRFLDTGNLQFDRDLVAFHKDKMSDRRREEGLKSSNQDYLIVEHDVLRIARGQYERWPLSR